MQLPLFGLVKQIYPQSHEPIVDDLLENELRRTNLLDAVLPGQSVLLTAGSRGIDSKPGVLAALVKAVKARGGEPFILPAMGSHGGGTGNGQVEVLAHLGITEKTVGAPVYGGWESVEIGQTGRGTPVFADRAAIQADHIILVNRIKEHTDFIGKTESGLIKIAAIGLGRQRGAASMHRAAVDIGLQESLHATARVLLEKLNILGGIAILEDHFNRLRRLEAVRADKLFEREPDLMEESRAFKPKLPWDRIDVLIIEEIGKEISGAGADTKVIGRIMNRFESECTSPFIKRVVILDLSKKTYGNAVGIGMADYTTEQAIRKIDHQFTALNCITGGRPELGRIPIALANDREAVETSFLTAGTWTPETARAVWIKDTKHLTWLAASSTLLAEIQDRSDLELFGEAFELPFGTDGALTRLEALIPDEMTLSAPGLSGF
jgi:hypothetical protein